MAVILRIRGRSSAQAAGYALYGAGSGLWILYVVGFLGNTGPEGRTDPFRTG